MTTHQLHFVTSTLPSQSCYFFHFSHITQQPLLLLFFFLNDPAPPEISPLPLPAPLPICPRQSGGWACPLQSIHLASARPATRAPATTSHGFGPPPLCFGFSGFGAGATGVTVSETGFSFVGASPRARAAMRLGLSLRRNAASSASGSASLPFRPFCPAAFCASSLSLSAARSIVWSIWSRAGISSSVAPRPSRASRCGTPCVVPPSWRPRRCPHTGRSRAAFATRPCRSPLAGRPNIEYLYRSHARFRAHLRKVGAPAAHREHRHAPASGDAVRAPRRARDGGLSRHAGDGLARHPGA